jgi:hypothetical protein
MESTDLEKTYSREQQGLGPGHEAVTSPVALVRSFTEKSRTRNNIDDSYDTEKEDPAEGVASPSPSALSSYARTDSLSEISSLHGEDVQGRRMIRFEDGDPENPNNWGRVRKCRRRPRVK